MKWSFQFFSNLFNTMPILGRYNAMADKLENPLPRYDPTESSSEEPASEQLVCKKKLKLVALRMSDGETSAVSDVDLSSDGASGSASDPEADEVERGSVDLTLQHLQSMHAMSRRQRELSTYATSGKSQKRVYQRLKNPICKCRCRVPFQALLKICVCFWMLSKQGQDSVLWAIQTEHPGTGCKKDWFIGGSKASKLCKIAWMHLLAIGRKRLQRCKNVCQGKDGRSTFGRALPSTLFCFGDRPSASQEPMGAHLIRRPQCMDFSCTCIGARENQCLRSILSESPKVAKS